MIFTTFVKNDDMEMTEQTTIEKALEDAYTYEGFTQLVDNLLDEGKSTGNTQMKQC